MRQSTEFDRVATARRVLGPPRPRQKIAVEVLSDDGEPGSFISTASSLLLWASENRYTVDFNVLVTGMTTEHIVFCIATPWKGVACLEEAR